jgi:Kef-type K+ transport system membrane component KefB
MSFLTSLFTHIFDRSGRALSIALTAAFTAIAAITTSLLHATPALAASAAPGTDAAHADTVAGLPHAAFLFLGVAAILVAAKVFHLIEKIKQPPVVGELVAGIILGNLAIFGFNYFDLLAVDPIIGFLAELGVIILLFQIGLESNVRELTKVGLTSLGVAAIGAIVPFVLGTYVLGPIFLGDQTFAVHLFLGASLVATSMGIGARVFRDLDMMQSKAARIFLGATVIDDIVGLVILAVISSLVTSGTISGVQVGSIIFKAFAFLIASVFLGQLLAPYISKIFAGIHTGVGSKFTLAVSVGLFFAGLASVLGLEPILGAFAGGLVLDPVHFNSFRDSEVIEDIKAKLQKVPADTRERLSRAIDHHAHRQVEDLIEPLALFFVPIFFVVTGMSVKLETLADPKVIGLAVAISIVAIIGKAVAGLAVQGKDRWIVGMAMVPRGEVGLIYAAAGLSLNVLSNEVFSVIVLTVLITTIVGPNILTELVRRRKDSMDKEHEQKKEETSSLAAALGK